MQVLLLFHIIVDFQLYIHWIHRVILVIILLMSVAATVGLHILWSDGWHLMHVSLMVNHLLVFFTLLLIFCVFELKRSYLVYCDNSGLLLMFLANIVLE